MTKEEVGQRQGIANPRNLKQLHNVKYLQDAKLKLGNDDIANLYELTMHLEGYAGLEIRGSKCYHILSFGTGMLKW